MRMTKQQHIIEWLEETTPSGRFTLVLGDYQRSNRPEVSPSYFYKVLRAYVEKSLREGGRFSIITTGCGDHLKYALTHQALFDSKYIGSNKLNLYVKKWAEEEATRRVAWHSLLSVLHGERLPETAKTEKAKGMLTKFFLYCEELDGPLTDAFSEALVDSYGDDVGACPDFIRERVEKAHVNILSRIDVSELMRLTLGVHSLKFFVEAGVLRGSIEEVPVQIIIRPRMKSFRVQVLYKGWDVLCVDYCCIEHALSEIGKFFEDARQETIAEIAQAKKDLAKALNNLNNMNALLGEAS